MQGCLKSTFLLDTIFIIFWSLCLRASPIIHVLHIAVCFFTRILADGIINRLETQVKAVRGTFPWCTIYQGFFVLILVGSGCFNIHPILLHILLILISPSVQGLRFTFGMESHHNIIWCMCLLKSMFFLFKVYIFICPKDCQRFQIQYSTTLPSTLFPTICWTQHSLTNFFMRDSLAAVSDRCTNPLPEHRLGDMMGYLCICNLSERHVCLSIWGPHLDQPNLVFIWSFE